MPRQISLSILEENPEVLPEEIQRMGVEALQIIWQTSQSIALQEVELVKKRYQDYETGILLQRQQALNQVEKVKGEINVANDTIQSLTRENKSLQVDLSRHSVDLKSAEDQIAHLKEKLAQQEHEGKRLIEELGRTREQVETLKKRLYEVERQAEQERKSLQEVREDIAVHVNTRERLEKNLKTAKQEFDEIQKQLRIDQGRATVADAVVQEMREVNKKYESEIKLLREEKQEYKTNLETEMKARLEVEKKLAATITRTESLENGYKEINSRREQELEVARMEVTQLRNRLVKTEGALEREKKAVERLETKLVATGGAKL
jgi:chromosome segregation ATPase